MNGFVIAGTHSGCGKTTVTLGILAALKKKKLNVQAFKTGPDFIDTGLHRLITGRPSRNLDLWMCGEDYVKDCFYIHSHDIDISVVEGVMGMYDGEFSTKKLAQILGLPIILVVDAYGIAESAGAIIKGFMEYNTKEQKRGRADFFTSELPNSINSGLIASVIFNRVASERHYERLKNSVQDIPVIGYLPRDLNFEIPHRHLGLTVAEERPIAIENIERLANAVLAHVDIDFLLLNFGISNDQRLRREDPRAIEIPRYSSPAPLRIAIAYDRAFCFYYEDNLDLLKVEGAEIVKFSPLSDTKIPEADALYIGGGYPEVWAKELSQNVLMLKAIHEWAELGKPIYAECGGLMYLSQGIYDFEGNFFKMVGLFPFETKMKRGRPHLGYREIQLKEDCMLGKKGERLRGHEFHYSEIKNSAQFTDHDSLYKVKNSLEQDMKDEGYRYKNTLASYVHIHFGSNANITKSFINFIKERRWKT